MNQEILIRAMELKQHSEEAENQLQFIEEQIIELRTFNEALHDFKGKKEMLSSIGKGVYVKTDIDEGKDFFVEVGAGVVLKKSREEMKKIIEEQIKKFSEARFQLKEQLENYVDELRTLMVEVEKLRNAKS